MTKTILLADDSLTIQKVVELTFADTPYNVVSVSSGDELLEKIPEVGPELIICDIIMPGRDGYDVCQDIKSSPDTLHIPVILLSGTFEPLDRDRALAVGCSDILTKPFEARKLIDAVETLLSGEQPVAAISAVEDSQSGADTGPVSQSGSEDGGGFGTRISSSVEEAGAAIDDADSNADEAGAEALDFTETGFAEMEAAGQPSSELGADLSGDELQFEIGGDAEIDPFADLDGDGSDESGVDDSFTAGNDPFAADDDSTDRSATTGEIFDAAERFADEGDVEGLEASTDARFGAEVPAADEDSPEDAGPAETPSLEPEFELQTVEEAFGETPAFTADADTAPLPPLDAESEEPSEEPAPGAAVAAGPLSDEDVDRIARRLLELAEEKIERIAWEVIPDVAEIVVRERIRKLEAEFETEN